MVEAPERPSLDQHPLDQHPLDQQPLERQPLEQQRGARRRAPSRGDLREQAILDAARQLLEVTPLSCVTIDDLARAAGLSRSSFYFYFDSKAAAFAALLDSLSEELAAENSPWLDGTGPDEPAMRQATAHSVTLWRSHGGLLRQVWRTDSADPQFEAWRQGVLERSTSRLADHIERDRSAGLAPAGPPSAPVLARALHGLKIELLAAGGPEQDDARLVDDLVAMTLRLLYPSTLVDSSHAD